MFKLIELIKGAPAVVVQTTVWSWHHPIVMLALGAVAVATGVYVHGATARHLARRSQED